jgi:hypothetical protein
LKKEQIAEWAENPVTLELKKCFEKVLDELETRGFEQFFSPGNPQLTQEALVRRAGVISAYNDVLDALEGVWDMFEEEESDEQ